MIAPALRSQMITSIRNALAEDWGVAGDVSSQLSISHTKTVKGVIRVGEACVLSGIDVAKATFLETDPSIVWHTEYEDGASCSSGIVAHVEGNALGLLAAERVALNFLAHLSGIATKTNQFVTITKRYGTAMTATRKTTPGLRMLEKQAVQHGGGMPHRYGLYDAILLKDNHLALIADLQQVIKTIRTKTRSMVQVEVDDLTDLNAVLSSNPDGILLDNMSPLQAKEAIAKVRKTHPDLWCEISGGITLENCEAFAQANPDALSTSVITQKSCAIDVSLDCATGGS